MNRRDFFKRSGLLAGKTAAIGAALSTIPKLSFADTEIPRGLSGCTEPPAPVVAKNIIDIVHERVSAAINPLGWHCEKDKLVDTLHPDRYGIFVRGLVYNKKVQGTPAVTIMDYKVGDKLAYTMPEGSWDYDKALSFSFVHDGDTDVSLIADEMGRNLVAQIRRGGYA